VPVFNGIGGAGGGILRENEYSETGVKNLFAAGTVAGTSGGGSHGFTWGCLIADHVTELIRNQKQEEFSSEQLKQIEETRTRVLSPLGRELEYTVNPLELEDYVRNININYVGIHRIKPRLERAIELLKFTEKGAVPLLTAQNPHELMRALEVQDIIEISQFHAQSAWMRNESRLIPVHYRDDYPDMDPGWDDMVVTIKKAADKITYEREHLN
jgi:succinate dehydrogenase/fumarate reductase flavoprotein subunit